MIINVTAHNVRFQSKDGNIYEIPPCGVVISATAVEEHAGTHPNGAELVRTKFVASQEMEEALARIEERHPNAIIVGSIIAAQAFPGRIFGMVPVQGFERVSYAEKRMRDDKFVTF